MRTFVYKCKKPFKGEIEIEVVRYKERLQYIKECNFQLDETGEAKVGTDQIDTIIKMIDFAEKHIKKVDVSCGDIKVTSFEDMQDYAEFDSLVSEVASLVINGGQVGKN